MSKPSWDDAPEWARWWVHCPISCEVMWFENEPIYCEDCQSWHGDPPDFSGRFEWAEPMRSNDEPWGVEERTNA